MMESKFKNLSSYLRNISNKEIASWAMMDIFFSILYASLFASVSGYGFFALLLFWTFAFPVGILGILFVGSLLADALDAILFVGFKVSQRISLYIIRYLDRIRPRGREDAVRIKNDIEEGRFDEQTSDTSGHHTGHGTTH